MNSKPLKTKKTTDAVKPKKSVADDTGQHIVVTNRPIIDNSASTTAPATDSTTEPTTVATARSKRIVIAPLSDDDAKMSVDANTGGADAPDTAPSAAATPETHAQTSAAATSTPPASNKTASEAPKEQDTSAKSSAPSTPATNTSATPTSGQKPNVPTVDDVTGPDKPSPETLKAVEAAEKREHELQEYIDSHQFFVPINETARKKSIKISFGLTFLLLLLGFVLVDLMLDSGIIDLINKIPHTHFFTS